MSNKETRNCHKCRLPQPIEVLEKINVKGTQRWSCGGSCPCKQADDNTDKELMATHLEELLDQLGIDESETDEFTDQDLEDLFDNECDILFEEGEVEVKEVKNIYQGKAKTYVITNAVSNSLVNKDFLSTLESFCEIHDAQLLIRRTDYRPNTGEDIWYDPAIAAYSCYDEVHLNNNLVFVGNFNIRPTAAHPLAGMQGYGRGKSLILGHTKAALQTVGTPVDKLPKLMYSTGAITEANYSNSKSGNLAKFHHCLSALIVEVIDDTKFMPPRHVHWNRVDGFTDICKKYYPDGTVEDVTADGMSVGDVHIRMLDTNAYDATFVRSNSLGQLAKPERVYLHDLHDHNSRNHHNQNDPFYNLALMKGSKDNVKEEVEEAVEFIENTHAYLDATYYIVGSNHNDALTRWVQDTDWKKDLINAEFYLETALMIAKSAKWDNGAKYEGAFSLWLKKLLSDDVKFEVLSRGQSHTLHGIDMHNHGDKGLNGARGSIASFARGGHKSVIGHSHAPGIRLGCYQNGCLCQLDMGYNSAGLSGWMHAHTLIHKDGKRQLICMVDGEFTTLYK